MPLLANLCRHKLVKTWFKPYLCHWHGKNNLSRLKCQPWIYICMYWVGTKNCSRFLVTNKPARAYNISMNSLYVPWRELSAFDELLMPDTRRLHCFLSSAILQSSVCGIMSKLSIRVFLCRPYARFPGIFPLRLKFCKPLPAKWLSNQFQWSFHYEP